jgi:accessory colonization factor AcfC
MLQEQAIKKTLARKFKKKFVKPKLKALANCQINNSLMITSKINLKNLKSMQDLNISKRKSKI